MRRRAFPAATHMSDDLRAMIAEYRAGLEAELTLLRQLDALSVRQHTASVDGDLSALPRLHDQRDAVMASLVAVEHDLRPLRTRLAERRQALQHTPEFKAVAALHADAAEMVTRIIASDQRSVSALKEAEEARRAAAAAMERGETTLQAYRRVVAPNAAHAALVNRRG